MKEAFDRIAPGWYNFRHWSIFPDELAALAQRWGGGKLLNVGSAHGPDFLAFREGFELYGIDIKYDFAYRVRPQEEGWDIGPYEHCVGDGCESGPR